MMASIRDMSTVCWRKLILGLVLVLLFFASTSCGNSVTAPTYTIEIFNHTKVNSGEPTRLFCVVKGSPPLPSANISVTNARGGDDGIGFLGTTSSSSTRTSWYRVVVGLGDAPQSFRCTLHSPDGSSVSVDLSVSIYEPPSFNVFDSFIQDVTSHSITLSWSPWTERRDYGDGPVIGYRVYFNEHGNHNVNPASNDLITDTSFTIHNLTRDTEYDITVAAVRPGPSGEGTYASASSHRTLCSAPSEAPFLSVQRRDQSSVTLGWEMISEESWGCSALSGINIIVDNDALDGFPQNFPFDAEDRAATIPGPEDCTTYRISAAFRNKDEMGISSDPLLISISLTRPPSVQGLQLSPFKTQIEVNWELPSTFCSPDYYIIRYGLYQKIACSSPEPTLTLTEVEVAGTTSRYNILGLDPYSRYQVSVIAVNGAGQSEETTGFVDTFPGQPSNITNVRVDQERTSDTSIGFTWQPLTCRNVNGVFSYYYARIYKDGDRNFRAAGSTYLDDDISFSYVEFDNLEPCTMYELNINAVNRDVRIFQGEDIRLCYASGVTGITFSSVGANAVSYQPALNVWWSVPSQCAVKVNYYKLSYQLISRQACPDVAVIDATVYHLNTTSSASLVQTRISSLEYYATYIISIKAVIGGEESLPRFVTGSTSEGDPTGPPTNIHSRSIRKRSIVFTWEKPECGYRNGPITSYTVMLTDSKGVVVHMNNVSDSEAVGYEIFSLTPYSNYSISVGASNYELEGEFGPEVWEQTAEARPAAPEKVTLPSSDQESITVEWVSPDPPEGRIIRYCILYWETDDAHATPSNVSIPCLGDQCSDLEYKFSGRIPNLKSDANYSVQVQAESIRGVGPKSPEPAIVRITSEGIPSDPQEVTITSSTETSLTITWAKPKYPRGRIISYKLAYKIKGKPYDSTFRAGEDFTMKQLDGDTTSLVLSDLVPATHYEVYVVASTRKGEGWSSEHVLEFTAPPPVDDLPKPSPPAIVMSPEGTPMIQFSDVLESPYITHMLVAVEERLPVSRRRRQQSEYGSYSENPSAYIAASISKDDLPIDFTIGDNNTYGIYHNAPLKDKAIYGIRIGVQSNVGGLKCTLFGDSSEFKTGPNKDMARDLEPRLMLFQRMRILRLINPTPNLIPIKHSTLMTLIFTNLLLLISIQTKKRLLKSTLAKILLLTPILT